MLNTSGAACLEDYLLDDTFDRSIISPDLHLLIIAPYYITSNTCGFEGMFGLGKFIGYIILTSGFVN